MVELHSGWLHKRGHVNTGFKRRWFVLDAGLRLRYYESPSHESRRLPPKGEVQVTALGHLAGKPPHLAGKGSSSPARLAAALAGGLVSRPGLYEGLSRLEDVAAAFRFETARKKPFVVYAESVGEKLAWMQVGAIVSLWPWGKGNTMSASAGAVLGFERLARSRGLSLVGELSCATEPVWYGQVGEDTGGGDGGGG